MGLDLFVERRKRNKNVEESTELAYFRKVNFLIPWFEKWFDEAIENCEPLPITKESCEALIETCREVLANHNLAREKLPTQEGFFFGSTDYDEYYFEDVEAVRKTFLFDVIPEFSNLEEGEGITFSIWC